MVQAVFLVFFARHLSFAVCAISSAPLDLDAPVLDSGFRPPVSVIVACKNEEAVVDRLLDGLFALDYPAPLLQLIVVDDGSDDRTLELLDAQAATHPGLEGHRPPARRGRGQVGRVEHGARTGNR